VEVIPALAPGPDDVVVTKSRYSAFVNTELESILRGNRIDTVVIAGLMTQYCSVTTARHAHDLDYKVVFVRDANAGPDLPDLGFGAVSHAEAQRVILTMLAGGVADIQTTADVVSALQG
jgi:nicotinamidase-related amidase